jgi:hypothetical protein
VSWRFGGLGWAVFNPPWRKPTFAPFFSVLDHLQA